jgi:hypothetical protein
MDNNLLSQLLEDYNHIHEPDDWSDETDFEFKRVVAMGKEALPTLHSHISDGWGVIGMIWLIAGNEAPDVPQASRGNRAEVEAIYRTWGEGRGYKSLLNPSSPAPLPSIVEDSPVLSSASE